MLRVSVLFWLILLLAGRLHAEDRNTGPWKLDELRKPPEVTLEEPDAPVTSLLYAGEPFRGKPTRVYAWLARPAKVEGKLPAMVLVHGGGGKAFREWAELWAERGYLGLAMDLAGHGGDGKPLPDGGPDQTDEYKFGESEVRDAWTYHAVANVIRGVSLLAARPEVDPERIGITGISWGGYLTCIVSGLDDRLKVSVPVYGCGFLHENSVWIKRLGDLPEDRRAVWIKLWDPSQYVGQAKMPVLFVNGTNDFAYPLDSYQKTYRLVKNRSLCVIVNLPHGHPQGWAPKEIGLFVDQHLTGGTPLPTIQSAVRKDAQVTVEFKSEQPIQSAGLHYTTDTGEWQKRNWTTAPARIEGNRCIADITGDPQVYFVTLTDDRGATVSTEHDQR